MPEVADLSCREYTFISTELEFCVPETLEDLAEAGEVLLPCGGEDDDVVQIKEAGFSSGDRRGHRSMSLDKVAGALQRPKST